MGRLHELLAVEGDLEGSYKKVLDDTAMKFTSDASLFFGSVRTMEWIEEGHPPQPPDYQELTTTVDKELTLQEEEIIRYFDAILQKECTNQGANADLIVDGVTIAETIPATFLLGMETRLKRVRAVYAKIPVLPSSIKWEKDSTKGNNIYSRTHPEEVMKTEKVFKVQVLYPATKEHPAQVDKISETRNVAVKKKEVWTGVLSPARKAHLLGKIDKLIQAVKKARQRANTTEALDITIGKKLFDYINS